METSSVLGGTAWELPKGPQVGPSFRRAPIVVFPLLQATLGRSPGQNLARVPGKAALSQGGWRERGVGKRRRREAKETAAFLPWRRRKKISLYSMASVRKLP